MSELEAIIADQSETIDQLRAELTAARAETRSANERVKRLEQRIENDEGGELGADDPYWSGVYDRIRAAWDRWALTELGTASPSPLDLTGRPELLALWESVK
jgi:hypothetical protein